MGQEVTVGNARCAAGRCAMPGETGRDIVSATTAAAAPTPRRHSPLPGLTGWASHSIAFQALDDSGESVRGAMTGAGWRDKPINSGGFRLRQRWLPGTRAQAPKPTRDSTQVSKISANVRSKMVQVNLIAVPGAGQPLKPGRLAWI